MLVLSRRSGEKIRIPLGGGEEILITVTKTVGPRVKLGFEAPERVKILRGELDPPEIDGLPSHVGTGPIGV